MMAIKFAPTDRMSGDLRVVVLEHDQEIGALLKQWDGTEWYTYGIETTAGVRLAGDEELGTTLRGAKAEIMRRVRGAA